MVPLLGESLQSSELLESPARRLTLIDVGSDKVSEREIGKGRCRGNPCIERMLELDEQAYNVPDGEDSCG
jgi:hypothetical protein